MKMPPVMKALPPMVRLSTPSGEVTVKGAALGGGLALVGAVGDEVVLVDDDITAFTLRGEAADAGIAVQVDGQRGGAGIAVAIDDRVVEDIGAGWRYRRCGRR